MYCMYMPLGGNLVFGWGGGGQRSLSEIIRVIQNNRYFNKRITIIVLIISDSFFPVLSFLISKL